MLWGNRQSTTAFAGRPLADLQRKVRDRDCILVIGAGVTAGLARDQSYTFAGFRESAAKYLRDHIQARGRSLSWPISDTAHVSQIVRRMKSEKILDGFMEDRFANLSIYPSKTSYDLLESLLDFGPLIFSTNYDDIIERETGFRSVTLTNTQTILDTVNNNNGACVVHLHGVFHDTNTIVLDEQSYSNLLNKPSWQVVRDYFSGKHFLFVGFNESMHDPAFRTIRRGLAIRSRTDVLSASWLRPKSESSAPPKDEFEPERYYYDDDTAIDSSQGPAETRRLANALTFVSAPHLSHPLKKIPVAYPQRARRAHLAAMTAAGTIKMAAHKGTWLRTVLLPYLAQNRIGRNRSRLSLTAALLAPCEGNFARYHEVAAFRGHLSDSNDTYREFCVDILATVLQMVRTHSPLCSVSLNLSKEFYYFRTTLIDDEKIFLTTSSQEPVLLLRNRLDRALAGKGERVAWATDQDVSAKSVEDFFFVHFSRALEHQFSQAVQLPVAKYVNLAALQIANDVAERLHIDAFPQDVVEAADALGLRQRVVP